MTSEGTVLGWGYETTDYAPFSRVLRAGSLPSMSTRLAGFIPACMRRCGEKRKMAARVINVKFLLQTRQNISSHSTKNLVFHRLLR